MAETQGAWPAAIEAEHARATAALDMPLLEGQAAVVQPRVYQLELLALAMKHNVSCCVMLSCLLHLPAPTMLRLSRKCVPLL
jgi:hypothetical protein